MENGLFKDELPTVTIKWWVSIANCWTTRGVSLYHHHCNHYHCHYYQYHDYHYPHNTRISVLAKKSSCHHHDSFSEWRQKSVNSCHFTILIILPPSHSTHPVTTGPASLRLWGSPDPGSSSFSIFWTAPGPLVWSTGWSTVHRLSDGERWFSLGWSGNYPAW